MDDSTRPARSEASRRRRRRHRRETTMLGAGVLMLAAIGLIFLIWKFGSASVQFVKDYIGPPETVDFFEGYIAPVVMQDPDPFTDASKLDSQWIVKTAVWAALTSDENQGKYSTTDDDREIIPIDDIARQIEKLFGDGVKPAYSTFTDGDSGAKYEYDKRDKCYYIPMIAISDYYTPSVRTIKRGSGTVKLTVDYISGQGWQQDSAGTVVAPDASKTMIYTLKGSRGRYAIVSVEEYKAETAVSTVVSAGAAESVPEESAPPASSSSAASASKTSSKK